MQVVAILGNNACGWMAAAALARQLPRNRYDVVVIDTGRESDGLGDFGSAIAVPPSLAGFHAGIGVDENALIASGGSYALGVAFSGWRADGATGFLPFGETGAPMGSVAFPQIAARLRAGGQAVRLADHSLAALAAQANRFVRPPRDAAAPLSGMAYGLHVETRHYAGVLRMAALTNGAQTAAAPLREAMRDVDGLITGLAMADDTVIAPMLVLDCSGAAPVVANGEFEDWSGWLPCDRISEAVVAADDTPPPYAHVQALDSGWTAALPLVGGDVRLTVQQGGDGDMFRNGARTAPWTGNCLAMGAAACVLEPLHPTALTLVRNALARLIALFPAGPQAPVEAVEFNRVAANEQARARDFVIGQYIAAGRPGAFWHERRTVSVSTELFAKRELFAARGRVPMFDDEIFEEEDWSAMFDTAGLVPRRHDALADQLEPEAIQRHLATHRARLIEAVRAMPSHAEALMAARRRVAA